MLKTQNVSVDWDSKKKGWIVRIQIGEEIIRRPLGKRLPHEAEEHTLRDAAVETARDDGYDVTAESVTVAR
jgi:hypothetical protein